MAGLLQQNLPRIEIPTFNGSPLKWVEFVIKFKEIVHNHVYLTKFTEATLLTETYFRNSKESNIRLLQ